MSTKTTFKRIALVAVAALGFGMLSVVPSSAALTDLQADATSLSATSSSTTVGAAASITLSYRGLCQKTGVGDNSFGVYAVYPLTVATPPSGATFNKPTMSVGADDAVAGAAQAIAAAGDAVEITCAGGAVGAPSPYAGTVTVSWTPTYAGTFTFGIDGVYRAYAKQVWTVTVAGKAAANTASTTSVGTAVGTGSGTDATAFFAPKAATGASVLDVVVTASNGAVSGALVDSDAKAKIASISGPGTIKWAGGSMGRNVSSAAGTLAQTLSVYGDGTSGVSTITITDSAGNFVKTETITFYGSVAKLTATAVKSSISDAAGSTAVVKITAADAAGVAVPLVAGDGAVAETTTALGVTAVSDAAAAGVVTVSVDPTATKTGSKKITWTTTDGLVSAAYTFTVGLDAAASITVTPSDTALVPGQMYTAKLTVKDAGGFAVPDGARTISATTTRASSVTLPTSADFVGGVATVTLYASVTPGDLTITVTDGDVSGTAVVNVSDPTAAAADAAAEATDAANAATDAANAAAEAADAATAAAQDAADAVAALSAQVADLIAGLKAQLTALTNLVIKIQKKVKA